MNAYARRNGKWVIGPATVGGVQAGAFKIGDAAGTLDNILACKLVRAGGERRVGERWSGERCRGAVLGRAVVARGLGERCWRAVLEGGVGERCWRERGGGMQGRGAGGAEAGRRAETGECQWPSSWVQVRNNLHPPCPAALACSTAPAAWGL